METLVPERLKSLVANEKATKDLPPAEQLRKLLTGPTKPTGEQVIDEVVCLQKDLFLDEPARNAALSEAVFSDTLTDFKKLVERVKIAKDALRKCITPNAVSQRELISNIESLTAKQPGAVKASVMKLAPSILKFLYDEEILEEENILIWYGGLMNRPTQFVKATEPFCKWLEEADEESDEDEDEEEEEEEHKEEKPAEEDIIPEAQPVDAETAAEIDAL